MEFQNMLAVDRGYSGVGMTGGERYVTEQLTDPWHLYEDRSRK